MNKIFKVIYNKTKHCYVVVSELAKSHCKSTQCSTAKSKTALTAAVLLALGTFTFTAVPTVQATDSLFSNDYVGTNYKKDDGKSYSESETKNYHGAGAQGVGSNTLGLRAQAGKNTVTIGDRDASAATESVYIGAKYDANNQVHPSSGTEIVSVGYGSDAAGTGSIAIGSGAAADTFDNAGSGTNPDKTSQSIAIGNNAKAKQNNIAIGAGSVATEPASKDAAYLTKQDAASSYVSVGSSDVKRRISNVADGAAASDVATVGQLQALSDKVGVYDAGFGIKIDSNTAKKTNTISLNRNLGKDYNTTDGVNLKNDTAGTSLILGGRVEKGNSTGGQTVTGDYGALGKDSVTVGGVDNTVETTGDAAVVVGGIYNKAAGKTSAVVGGSANDAIGNESSVFGGFNNDATGLYATISGGSYNRTYGEVASVFGGSINNAVGSTSSVFGGSINTANGTWSSVVGGSHNTTLGLSSTAVGGENAIVDGMNSVGIAGGSTNADYALAAGNGATVTVNNGTAIGYQATANKEGTVAFGHDKGDVYYTSTWLQKATEKDGKYYDANNKEITKDQYEALRNADLTFNDYSQKPTVTENKYGSAAYNRLVKVADGIDDHDVVVMEQLNKAKTDLTSDLSVNAGWGINVADVTTKNDDGTETTTKNVISLNRNLGTNYGNPWKGKGKVTFEAGGENSLILGGAASILFHNEADDVKAGAYGKDSVLVGGFNNLITTNEDDIYKIQTGEDSVIVGGDTNTVTGQKSVIVGGYKNTATGSQSVINGGASNMASGATSSVFGGQQNTASGLYASVFGGEQNKASEGWSSAIGGTTNTASGMYAVTLGGENNVAKGQKATTVGGTQNMSIGKWSLAAGGFENTSYGDVAYTAGGMHNMAYGNGSVALGGVNSSVNGKASTGIAGGSTGENAMVTLAAGYQSVVTDGGVEWRTITPDETNKHNQGMISWPGFSGIIDYGDGSPSSKVKVLDRISTAVGYQSTADAPGVIAFGHDKGDVASVAKKWKQKATMEVIQNGDNYTQKFYDANHNEISSDEYQKLMNADGTWNDYTQAPVEEKTTYTSSYYNRLVKAADGIDAHDAVVMEQLKPYTKSDASNIGSNLKTYTVGDDGETITEAEASADAKNTNENAWGAALGTGKVADPKATGEKSAEKNGSQQLVTGGTVFNETRISAKDEKGQAKTYNYLNVNESAGKNLEALDANLKKVSTTAGAHTALTVEGNTPAGTQDEKTKENVYAGKNILLHESTDATTGKVTYDLKLSNDIMIGNKGKDGVSIIGPQGEAGKDGTDGKVGISGKDGKDAVSISGKDGVGHIGLTGPAGTNGKDGTNAIDITVKNGYDDAANGINGKNGVDGKDGITRIVYEDKTGEHQVATMEDGLKFKGDDGKEIAKKLNNTLEIIGGAKGDLTDGNIGVNSTKAGQLKVQLSKDLTGMNSTTYTTTTGEGESATTSTTVVNGNGMTITNGPSITNKGVDGGNKVITHVGNGIEKDANGKYTVTDQNKGNAANIGDVQNMVNDAKKDLTDGANGLNNKANIDASNIGTNLKNADGSAASAEDQKSNAEKWGKAIGTGKIEKGNGQLVTGDTVYNEVRPKKDGNYVKTNQTTGENLSALDSKIGKLDESKKYNYIDSGKDVSISDNLTKLDTQVKKNADNITNINQSISTLNQNAVKYDDSSKSKISLGGEGGTTITNVKDGSVAKDSKEAVNGGQLWAVDQKVNTNTQNIETNTTDIKNLKDLSNITNVGKTVIKKLSQDAVQIKAGTAITIDSKVDENTGNKTYTISANNNGTVAKGDGNLISGDTLYKEVHVDKDGSYIRSGNTVGQNLSALDSGLKTTSDLIHTNTKGDTIQIGGNSTATKIDVSGKDKDGNTTGRVITGIVTDGKDLTSAANVGYVNGITSANTQQIYRDMNNAYSRLDTNINKAAAGSNALAALHPLDFDPADKASFAVGYGHYHNANAAAIGAFYQPNANTMVNMGISLGNGDPGFNAGVSFKLGKGSAYNGVSKAEMAQTIHDQAEEISAIKANDAAKDKRIDALEKENQEMKKQIQEILSRLNG